MDPLHGNDAGENHMIEPFVTSWKRSLSNFQDKDTKALHRGKQNFGYENTLKVTNIYF
jgi:hypothetical protein